MLVAESIDDMHKVYPRDRDLPMLLYWCYTTLSAWMSDDANAGSRRTCARSLPSNTKTARGAQGLKPAALVVT